MLHTRNSGTCSNGRCADLAPEPAGPDGFFDAGRRSSDLLFNQ
jgi:hypothetical protein